jgi:D-alanyl-D-alanine carboxypeptidase
MNQRKNGFSAERAGDKVNTGKKAGIFIFLILLAALAVIVTSRARQNIGVVIDGGEEPAPTPTPAVTQTAEPTPAPTPTPSPTESLPDVDIDSWEFTVANAENTLKDVPQVSEVGKTGAYLDTRAIDSLNAMMKACSAAGYSVYLNLAYVPFDAQQYYYDNKVKELEKTGLSADAAKQNALKLIALPGQSDHQTGLGVDLTDKYFAPYTNETLSADTLSWLTEHCAEYGFIQRYPAGKNGVTGYVQSYHFRYVGKTAAQYIMDKGLCLEEFRALYK